jgi:hypothetical protein
MPGSPSPHHGTADGSSALSQSNKAPAPAVTKRFETMSGFAVKKPAKRQFIATVIRTCETSDSNNDN